MNTTTKLLLAGALTAINGSLYAADITLPRIIDSSTVWTADNTYFLDGYTFVVTPSGASEKTVLTIEPGTVIKGIQTSTEGNEASALVITAGAMIHAEGTPTHPIIFTSELDDLNGSLTHEDPQLWGGLVVLGNASINSRADGEQPSSPAVDQIEGFSVSAEEIPLVSFGGTDDDENSGVIKYLSIRHGGAVLGSANEINGLTMGGVGRGTTIEYVEVFANKDDGFEWFGGTVSARYLVSVFNNDDSFDYDQGWRGMGQFWFTIGTDIGLDQMDKGGEHDGATSPKDADPVGFGRVFNATYIGIGNSSSTAGNTALNIRDNGGAEYYNSIFLNFTRMIDLEDDAQLDASGNNMVATTDFINFENNIWWSHVAENNTASGLNARPTGLNAAFTEAFFTDSAFGNQIVNPMLSGIGYSNDGMLDPRPAAGSPALSAAVKTVPANDFYVQTNYLGAFSQDYNWMAGWTKLSTEGYLAASPTWFPHPKLGWIFIPSGVVVDAQWVFVADLNRWSWFFGDGDLTVIGVF